MAYDLKRFFLKIENQLDKWNNTGVTKLLVIIVCLVSLVSFLKLYLHIGDVVISGISAALITLMGVRLTIKNSQIVLDKQLKHQENSFEQQLNNQIHLKNLDNIFATRMKIYFDCSTSFHSLYSICSDLIYISPDEKKLKEKLDIFIEKFSYIPAISDKSTTDAINNIFTGVLAYVNDILEIGKPIFSLYDNLNELAAVGEKHNIHMKEISMKLMLSKEEDQKDLLSNYLTLNESIKKYNLEMTSLKDRIEGTRSELNTQWQPRLISIKDSLNEFNQIIGHTLNLNL